MDEDSEIQWLSRYDSRPFPSEKEENSFNFSEMIKQALKEYEDIDDEEFQIIEGEVGEVSQSSGIHYMNNHSTLVPIGANYQAHIPSIIPEQIYKRKSAESLANLKHLKVNDPQQGQQFFIKYGELVEEKVGGKTYEDINLLRNAYQRLRNKAGFEDYLEKNGRYWQYFFKQKEKVGQNKLGVKKKKKKGTIPT